MSSRYRTGAQAVGGLPSTIRIGPFTYSINVWPLGDHESIGRFGNCIPDALRINICSEMPSPHKAMEVFLHELTHAIMAILYIDEQRADSESIASGMGIGFTMAFRDNPWLIPWIENCVGSYGDDE